MQKAYGVGSTDAGRHEPVNEDAFYVDNGLGLYMVADGMGGEGLGDVASQQSVEAVYGVVRRDAALLKKLAAVSLDTSNAAPDVNIAVENVTQMLRRAVQTAAYMVFGLAQETNASDTMSTSLSILAVCGAYAITAHVGDSRIYWVRGDHATCLTQDHTFVAWQLQNGILTEAQARRSPYQNVITRAVGHREYTPVDTHATLIHAEDRFFLCTRGLSRHLAEEEIPPLVIDDPSQAVMPLLQLGNQRGGTDNMTAVVVHVAA